jgi:hypothetical protein
MMEAAREQALRYVRALPPSEPRPPFIVVVDIGYCFDLYSNFAGVGDGYVPFPDSTGFRIMLPALAQEESRARLRQLFTDPQQLDPSRRAAQVTRQLAHHLAGLSSQLERAGYASEVVAQFLMRCVFTMFAEDVELIPKKSFTKLLADYAGSAEDRANLPAALQSLWVAMDKGGFSPALRAHVRQFNGKLFHDATALPLTANQLTLLQQAAAAEWQAVEPAIFGTLLERALDPRERHSLGAHYTPRRYVERLVLPTVLEPLRREWAAAQAASAQLLDAGKGPKAAAAAREELLKFLRRLTSVRILDPACGSGNFLYVTLEHLKRLEGEVLAALGQLGSSGRLELGDGTTVSPRQLLGLELNPRAAAIADVVLRIGYLQWHLRTHGLTQLREPLLDDYQNIRQQDAVLATGSNLAHPHPAAWPEAEFIVGNPPFVGASRMRDALGDAYTLALRQAYASQVPDSADLVMFWWQRAAAAVQAGRAERFGFITTNSLRQTFNRRVMQPFLDGEQPPLALTFAIPDHPWVDSADGAAVRVAFTVAERAGGAPAGQLLRVLSEKAVEGDDAFEVAFGSEEGRIQPDLSIGAELDSVKPLSANAELASRGVQLYGAGFILSESEAEMMLYTNSGARTVIRPYLNGRDFTGNSRGVKVIDFFGLTDLEAIQQFPRLYQHVAERVKPERDRSNEPRVKANWWLHGRTREEMRQAMIGLPRYIATVETAKHRIFQFLDTDVLPDNMLVAIALDNAYQLGVLSSQIHVVWALATGGDLGGNTPRYNKTRCFDPFPFPNATSTQQAHIRELAEALDAHRKRQQAQHPSLTLTDLYNVVEKLRAGQAFTAKEKVTHEQGLAAVVLSLHQQLDVAVAAAYGWPADLADAELLTRLVALNHARAAEEKAGIVRYLRPSYQAPGQQQAALALPVAKPTATALTDLAIIQPWPTELAQQMQAVRAVVAQAATPITIDQVAARFRRTRPERVQPLLDTLEMLKLVRFTPEGAYAG